MRTFNKNLAHGTISGNFEAFPNAKYVQGGAYFTATGICLSIDGVNPYDPAKDKAAPGKGGGGKDVLAQKQAELEEVSAELAGYDAEVTRLTNELDAAKSGDINAKGYTDKCSELQGQLTSMRGKQTKANNRAATLENEINKLLAAK